MSGEHSVSWWIRGLKHGDEDAAARLWERYFERIVRLARARLKGAPRRVADEEDVALSAFRSLCAGAERSRFPEVESRLRDREERKGQAEPEDGESHGAKPSGPSESSHAKDASPARSSSCLT